MPLREQQPEIEQEDDTTLAVTDSTLRRLDVAKGREKHLTEQVDKLERRLLEKEKELTGLQRELKNRSEAVGEIQRTFSWRVTKPLRAVRRLLSRP